MKRRKKVLPILTLLPYLLSLVDHGKVKPTFPSPHSSLVDHGSSARSEVRLPPSGVTAQNQTPNPSGRIGLVVSGKGPPSLWTRKEPVQKVGKRPEKSGRFLFDYRTHDTWGGTDHKDGGVSRIVNLGYIGYTGPYRPVVCRKSVTLTGSQKEGVNRRSRNSSP